MIGTITHILAKAGYKAMNGPLADERRRLAGAVPPAAYVSYDPRLLAGVGWYGYRIALKGGDRSMLERARYMLEQQYVIRDRYEYYADDIYTLGVMLRQRVPHYGIGGGGAAQEPDALNFYMPNGGTITLTKNGTPTVVELEYSIDGGATWHIWEEVGNVRSLTLAAGQKMYVRNTSETSTGFGTSSSDRYRFAFDSYTYAGGNIMSLLSVDSSSTTIPSYCFQMLFYNSTLLLTPADMSGVTSISNDGCYLMYAGCTSLTTAADISSVTSIGSEGCSSMYNSCTSLTTAADMSSVTNIDNKGCRQMYSRCTSLTTAADMNNITIINSQSCDSMYFQCTSLTTASDISSVTSIGQWGCKDMYNNCASLATVIIGNPTISSQSLKNWLAGVAATGDFYCSPNLTLPTGASGIPSGWTRHDI